MLTMNSTVVFSDTEINQAKLLSYLSGRPAKVAGDIFVWNGSLVDRATAVVAFLKVNNQVPVGDSVKMRLHQTYTNRFADYAEREDLAGIIDDHPDKAARIWFNLLCRIIKGKNEPLSNDVVKQILVDLHS
jgi:hypothetical protein